MIYHNFIIEVNNDNDEYEIQLNNIKKKRLVAFMNNETIHDYMMRSGGPIERIYSKVAENSLVVWIQLRRFKPEDFIVSVDLYDDMRSQVPILKQTKWPEHLWQMMQWKMQKNLVII